MENSMKNTTNIVNINIQADNLNSFVIKKSGEIKWAYKNPELSQTFPCKDINEKVDDAINPSPQSSDDPELKALHSKRSRPISITYNISAGIITNDQDHTNLTHATKEDNLVKGEKRLDDLLDTSPQSSDDPELKALHSKRSRPLSITYNISTGIIKNDQDQTNLTRTTKGDTLVKGESGLDDLLDTSPQSSDDTELRALRSKRSRPLSITYSITTGIMTNDQDHKNLTHATKEDILVKGKRGLSLETPGCSWNNDLKQFDSTIYPASKNVNGNRERITSEESNSSKSPRGSFEREPSEYVSSSESELQKAVCLTIIHNIKKLHDEILHETNTRADKETNVDHSAQSQEKKGETYRTHNNLTSDTGTSVVTKRSGPDSDQTNDKWKALFSNVNESIVDYSVTESPDKETIEKRNLLNTHPVSINHREFSDIRQGIRRYPRNNLPGCLESRCDICDMRDDTLCLPNVEQCDIFDLSRYLYNNSKPCRNKTLYVHNLTPCVEGRTNENCQSVQHFERVSSLLNPENNKENWNSIQYCNADENHTMGNGTIEKCIKDINSPLGLAIMPNTSISKSQGNFTDSRSFCSSFFSNELRVDAVPSFSIDNETNESSMVKIPVKMLESRIGKGMHYGNSEAKKRDFYDKMLINIGTPLVPAVKSSIIQREIQNKVDDSAAHKKIIRHFLNNNVKYSDVSFLSANLNDSSEYITASEYDVFPHFIINKGTNKTLTLQKEGTNLYLNNIQDITPKKDVQSQNVKIKTEALIPTLKTVLPAKCNHESVNSTLNKTCNNIDILNRGNTSQNNGPCAISKTNVEVDVFQDRGSNGHAECKWICSNPFLPSNITKSVCGLCEKREYANASNPHDDISSNPQGIIVKGFNNIDAIKKHLQSAFCKRACHFDDDDDEDIPKLIKAHKHEIELDSIYTFQDERLNHANVTQKREDCSDSYSKTVILQNHNNAEHVSNSKHPTLFPHNNTTRNESSIKKEVVSMCMLIGTQESAILHSSSALSRGENNIHNSLKKIRFGIKNRRKTASSLKNCEDVCNLSSDGIIIISLQPLCTRKKSGVSQPYFEYREKVYTNPIVVPAATVKIKKSLSDRKSLCYSKDNVCLILNNDSKFTKKSLLWDSVENLLCQEFATEIHSRLPKIYPNVDAERRRLGEENGYDYHDETKGRNLFNSLPNRKYQSEMKRVCVDYEEKNEEDGGKIIESVKLKQYEEYSYSISSSHTFKRELVSESSDKLPSLATISSQESAHKHESREYSSKRSPCKQLGRKKCAMHRKQTDKQDKGKLHGQRRKKSDSSRMIRGNVTPSSRSCEIELTSIQYEDIPDPIISHSSRESLDRDLRYYNSSDEQIGVLGTISTRAKRVLSEGQRAISSGISSVTTKMFCLFNRTTPKR